MTPVIFLVACVGLAGGVLIGYGLHRWADRLEQLSSEDLSELSSSWEKDADG